MTNKTLSERIAELNEIKKSYMFEPTNNEFFKAMKVIEELQAENKIWQEMVDSTNQTNQALIKRLQENNEECVEPVSIWKDVSEFPKILEGDTVDSLIRDKNGNVARTIFYNQNGEIDHSPSGLEFEKEYCTLTDFVKSFEQMGKI
jgi:uncharacterized protein (UPF0147 family)